MSEETPNSVTLTVEDAEYIREQFKLMKEEIERLQSQNEDLQDKLDDSLKALEPTPIKEVLGDEVFHSLGNYILNREQN